MLISKLIIFVTHWISAYAFFKAIILKEETSKRLMEKKFVSEEEVDVPPELIVNTAAGRVFGKEESVQLHGHENKKVHTFLGEYRRLIIFILI